MRKPAGGRVFIRMLRHVAVFVPRRVLVVVARCCILAFATSLMRRLVVLAYARVPVLIYIPLITVLVLGHY